ncbi:hypothetical protein ACJ41O_010994 [Fusarium nematophilum]
MASISGPTGRPSVRYAGRRRVADPSTSILLQPHEDEGRNLNTLSLLIEDKIDTFRPGDCIGRVTHIPLTHIGAGKTFSAGSVDLGDGRLKVLKRPRFETEGKSPESAWEVQTHRNSMAQSILTEFSVLTHPPLRDHENILSLQGIGWESDPLDESMLWPIMVVEWAKYGSLLDFVRTNPLSLATKTSLFADVACGLSALHECGVVHGDIKCGNILVFPTDKTEHGYQAKLADFGYSVFAGESDASLIGGTWPWNAPEWRTKVDRSSLPKSDIFSFGLLVMQVLENGSDPFSSILDRSVPPGRSRVESVEDLKRTGALLELFQQKAAELCTDSREAADIIHGLLEMSIQPEPDKRRLDAILKLLGKGRM